MCRFLSILYKTYDQIFFKYMLFKIKPYYSFYHTNQGTVLAVRYQSTGTITVPLYLRYR